MSNPVVVVVVTILLIALSAFFVAAEFALLAGCQLGITACALALGAITKPAVKYALMPVFESTGAPGWVADSAAFVLALIVVTFLHLVVGEMAPKSWAIAHPESAATLLALPIRGFMWLTRPLLGS